MALCISICLFGLFLKNPHSDIYSSTELINKYINKGRIIYRISAVFLTRFTIWLQIVAFTGQPVLPETQTSVIKSLCIHCAQQCATAHFSWKMPGVVLVLVGFTQRLQSLPGMYFSGLYRIECCFQLVCCTE